MLSEDETRRQKIDLRLARAGWSGETRRALREYHLGRGRPASQLAEDDEAYLSAEYIDYMLPGQDGDPLAIVEAKREGRDALAGKRQAADYADRLREQSGHDPFVFLTNGEEIWFWDRERYPPRPVSGFFTRDDLERLAFQRKYALPLTGLPSENRIAGRPYQIEAIKRVTEAIERGRRKFLLVMATGTGKTRTTIALVELLMRARRVQRVLFLADRRELVKQAVDDFREYLPSETRARIEAQEIDETARIHIATYPSMVSAYQQLSPGYYDLIVADESHRSIYNRYKVLFDYFDAFQLGLTATPTDYLDHNTFELFECEDGLPTFYYPYETAVEEDWLADYRVLSVQTTFQVKGIKAGELPLEVRQQMVEQGIELSAVDFEGTDLEQRVTNSGTNDAIVREFMDKCRKDASGTLPAKTILFATSHAHAVEIWKSFNRLYPALQRRGMAEIIDSHMERAEKTLSDFKRRDMPRVAISVDMLDTGIDVPTIQNLVFAKPVYSQVKFWQMIGRGTRRWRDPESGKLKEDFLILDFWNNFAYFNMNPQSEEPGQTEALPVRLFRLRLEKWQVLRALGRTDEAAQTSDTLRAMLAGVPRDNLQVQPLATDLERLVQADAWLSPSESDIRTVHQIIAPLLRFVPEVNLPRMIWEVRTERLALAVLRVQPEEIQRLRGQIVDDLQRLPTSLRPVQLQLDVIKQAATDHFWEGLDYSGAMTLQARFAPLMGFRQPEKQTLVELHLPDQIARRRWIIYGPSGERAFADHYQAQVETELRELADQHPALRKLQQGASPTDEELDSLSSRLNQADLFVTEKVLRQLYERPHATLLEFVRHILEITPLPSREQEIRDAFEAFIAAHSHFSATQILFLRTIRSAMLRRSRLSVQDLEQPPFDRIGRVTRLFAPDEIEAIIVFANQWAA